MDNYFFNYNRSIDEKLDECIHNVERQIDKLFKKKTDFYYYGCLEVSGGSQNNKRGLTKEPNPYSTVTFSHFRKPYIRDFRNFSPPNNNDLKQIKELTRNENIDYLVKYKTWTKETKQQLVEAIQDFYATSHTVRLIKQEENLLKLQQSKKDSTLGSSANNDTDLKLIEEQKEQVKNRKDPRIFVPEDRLDPSVDWCGISAKLSKTLHDSQDCRLLWQNELHWSINNNLWSKEEDDCLLKAVERHGKNNWDAISKELNSNRLPWQCCARFQQEFAKSGQTPINQADADKILDVVNLCRIGNYVPWNQVMYFIKFHCLSQVKYQWNKTISDKCMGQSWTPEEDNLLLDCVEKFGHKDWNRIASFIPNRTNRSCRERYVMRLRFDTRSLGKWTRKEDLKLINYVDQLGTKWAPLSSHFDRNEHQIRNRYKILRSERRRLCRRAGAKRIKVVRESDGLHPIKRDCGAKKPDSERELDQTLQEILSSYQNIKTNQRKLVCRSGLDEVIYQNLVFTIKTFMSNQEQPSKGDMLADIIHKALEREVTHDSDILTPCYPTIQGYKAWLVHQGYLSKITNDNINIDKFVASDEYDRLKEIVISLFLWPAILSRLKPKTDIKPPDTLFKSIIASDSKNLFKIREIQNHLKPSN